MKAGKNITNTHINNNNSSDSDNDVDSNLHKKDCVLYEGMWNDKVSIPHASDGMSGLN
jgi:hypothetical protein